MCVAPDPRERVLALEEQRPQAGCRRDHRLTELIVRNRRVHDRDQERQERGGRRYGVRTQEEQAVGRVALCGFRASKGGQRDEATGEERRSASHVAEEVAGVVRIVGEAHLGSAAA